MGIEITLLHGPLNGMTAHITSDDDKRGVAYIYGVDATATYVRNEHGVWCWVDESALPDIPATTGRIVWYMPTEKEAELIPGIDFSQDHRTNYLPAMVVRAHKDGTVNLKAFGANGIDLYVEGVPYSNAGKFRTWRWPIKSDVELFVELVNSL